MRRLTKTFVQNVWYRRVSAGSFVEVSNAESQEQPPLDTQIREWVNATGNIIIHPGQLGMHTSWHGDAKDPYQIKCLTFGLTVLYQEPEHVGKPEPIQHADPYRIDRGASAVEPGTINPIPWSDDERPADGTRAVPG